MVSLWIGLPQFVDPINIRQLHPMKHLRSTFSLFLPTIASSVYTIMDKTMIGVITSDSTQNGYYEQATNIARMALMLVTSLGTVIVPRIGYFFNIGDDDKVKYYIYRSYHFVWMISVPLCFGLIGVAHNFVPWFYGEGYDGVTLLVDILSILVILVGISNVTGIQYFIPTKRQRLLTRSVCYGAAINVLLNSILIPQCGAAGAAGASIISELFIMLIQIWYVKKEIKFGRIIKMSLKYFTAAGLMLIVLKAEDYFMKPEIINTVAMIISGGFVYVMALLLMKDSFFLELYRQLRHKKDDIGQKV
jgi:O-antigen/teichoic acid export membrane protein